MSMWSSFISGAFERSSALIRWIGFLPIDARHGAGARRELDALADEHLRVPAADADEAQEPGVLDVRDDEPDLVDVPDDRDGRAVRRCPGTRAVELPITSARTSSVNVRAASRKAAAAVAS